MAGNNGATVLDQLVVSATNSSEEPSRAVNAGEPVPLPAGLSEDAKAFMRRLYDEMQKRREEAPRPPMAKAFEELPAVDPNFTRMARITWALATVTGRLVDVQMVATPWSEQPRVVLVLRSTTAVRAMRDDVMREAAAGELVHVDAPELAMLQALCSDPDAVRVVTFHKLPGACRWAADVSKATVPRAAP